MVVYIAHPFASDPRASMEAVRVISREVALRGALPLAPQLLLGLALKEPEERDLGLRLCLRMVAMADEVRVYGEPTEGMRLEIAEAERLGIPIVRVRP